MSRGKVASWLAGARFASAAMRRRLQAAAILDASVVAGKLLGSTATLEPGGKRGVDRIIIAGDPLSADAISSWEHVTPPVQMWP